MTEEQREFIEKVAPIIQKYAPKYNIAVCSPIIAQCILESGWGKSKLAATFYNFFGLKCGSKWTGKSVSLKTSEEYTKGTYTNIRDNFRVYDNLDDGIKGYFEFIQLERYHNLRGITDPKKYLETIKADGYATSSSYVSDLMKVIETYDLTKYDKGETMKHFSSVADSIDALIATANAEVGYLEKKSNSNLDSKTANAGTKNYTKYWRDIKPSWNGYSWCACFVTWCFVATYGQDETKKLLKHYPFLYCPTLAAKTTNKTPKRGSLILFYRPAKKRYGHVGIVYKVTKTYVYTIEGNTSGGTGIEDNGQGVAKKKYKRANLDSRTKYFMPDYAITVDKDSSNINTDIYQECSVKLHEFLMGAEHPEIMTIQYLLNAHGFKGEKGKLTVDGKLGEETAYAIASFQESQDLGIKNTGTVGKKTWTALLNMPFKA